MLGPDKLRIHTRKEKRSLRVRSSSDLCVCLEIFCVETRSSLGRRKKFKEPTEFIVKIEINLYSFTIFQLYESFRPTGRPLNWTYTEKTPTGSTSPSSSLGTPRNRSIPSLCKRKILHLPDQKRYRFQVWEGLPCHPYLIGVVPHLGSHLPTGPVRPSTWIHPDVTVTWSHSSRTVLLVVPQTSSVVKPVVGVRRLEW